MRPAVLSALLVAASLGLYFVHGELDEPRRFALSLATVGFFWAPESQRHLKVGLWLVSIGAVAWVAQMVGRGFGGLPLWMATSVLGALLMVRGGSRATAHYLPPSGSELGAVQRRLVRLQLRVSVALFLSAYLFGARAPGIGALVVAASAAFFLRYILLQAKFLGIPARPIASAGGIVWAQRWVVLVLFALLASGVPAALLATRGPGPLLVTAALLALLAALVLVLALVRSGFPRSFVRRASFAAGIALAVTVTAVLVELESWGPSRYRFFASAPIFFLVALPFLKEATSLFDAHESLGALVPSTALSAMLVPVTALNGTRWSLSTTVFLFALGALILLHHLLVAFREGRPERMYLSLSLLVTVYLFVSASGGGAWQVFFLSAGLALYSVELFERMWRKSRAGETMTQS